VGLNELWQQERDLMDWAWRTSDNALDRAAGIAVAEIAKEGKSSGGSDWGSMLSQSAGTILVKGISNIMNWT